MVCLCELKPGLNFFVNAVFSDCSYTMISNIAIITGWIAICGFLISAYP